jgi:hypothetical protein
MGTIIIPAVFFVIGLIVGVFVGDQKPPPDLFD